MKNTKEIKALFNLLDDPDREIFDTVADKIIDYGKEIIPNLEQLWEQTEDDTLQERIENLIHKVSFTDTEKGFEKWFQTENANLLDGAILLSGFRYAEVKEEEIRKVIKTIYQSCWLELHNFLTPLEQINIINSIFYSMYKFYGHELETNNPNHYFINDVTETRAGNSYSLGLLYQYLCGLLDLPVFAIQLPRQYLLAYFTIENNYFEIGKPLKSSIQFYIDPSNGTIFSQNDVDAYLNKYELSITEKSLLPMSNVEIISSNMEALILVYEQLEDFDKIDELNALLNLRNND